LAVEEEKFQVNTPGGTFARYASDHDAFSLCIILYTHWTPLQLKTLLIYPPPLAKHHCLLWGYALLPIDLYRPRHGTHWDCRGVKLAWKL